MKKVLALLILVFLTNLVQADKLCIKKNQKVINGKVKLSKVLKTETDCPRRFLEVLNLDSLNQNPFTSFTTVVSSNAPAEIFVGGKTQHEGGCEVVGK